MDDIINKQVEEFIKNLSLDKHQIRIGNTFIDKEFIEANLRSSMLKVAERIANKIYDAIPSGEVTAFDLIKIMKKLYEEVSLTEGG